MNLIAIIIITALTSLQALPLLSVWNPLNTYWDPYGTRAMQEIARELHRLNNHLEKQPRDESKITIYNQGTHVHTSVTRGGAYPYSSEQNKYPVTTVHDAQATPSSPSLFRRFTGFFSNMFSWKKPQPQNPEPTSFIGYISSDKKSILMKAILAAYVWTNYRLFQLRTYLQDAQRWCYWKSQLSLAQLLELPQKELAHELIMDAQRRYPQEAQATPGIQSISTPLTNFLQAIEEETVALNKYLMIANTLTTIDAFEQQCASLVGSYILKFYGFSLSFITTYLASKCAIKSLFYLDEKLTNTVQEKLSRLAYLKNIFSHWITEFKVRSASKLLLLKNIDQFNSNTCDLPSRCLRSITPQTPGV